MTDHECPDCGARFSSREELERHRGESHQRSVDRDDPLDDRLHAETRLGGSHGIELGPEAGSTGDEQLASGLGDADMGAVDERIDLGTTLDTGPTAEELERGLRDETAGGDAHRCERCGARFGVLADLQRHYEQEHGEMRRVS